MNARTGSQLTRWLTYGLTFCLLVALMSGCSDKNPSSTEIAAISGTTLSTGTSGGSVSTAVAYIHGKIVSTSGSGVSGALVTLLNAQGVPVAGVAPVTTQSSGQYAFDAIATGIYYVTASHSDYLAGSQFVEAFLAGGNAVPDILLAKNPTPLSPQVSIDIKGRLMARDQDWSTALVMADSGQSTVAEASGAFLIKYIPGGLHTLTFSKPGINPYSVSVSISEQSTANDSDGFPIAASASFDSKTVLQADFEVGKSGRRIFNIGEITAPYNFHESAAFTGTAFYMDTHDAERVLKTPASFASFTLLAVDSTGNAGKFRDVMTDKEGRWQVDNVPSMSDNSYSWTVVKPGTVLVRNVDADGKVSYSIPEGATITQGYRAIAGKTTVIDVVLAR